LKSHMKNSFLKEIFVSLTLIVLAVLLLNPFHFWMPEMMVISILAGALVIFGVFASFILREDIVDERDNLHRTLAGRNAFLIGSVVLIVGILVGGYDHRVDPWLIVALTLMISVKIGTRIWSDYNC
jgi:hypothetical protein